MSARVVKNCVTTQQATVALDGQFDRLIPRELQHLSANHWTPLDVAVRAATLLCPTARTRILDVGSGIGKLCTVGALSTLGTWVGVEQHEPLVRTASCLARKLGVAGRTRFLQADAFSLDWNEYDALYFYNPFELSLFGEQPLNPRRSAQIARVQERLAALPNLTRVVTFHGFGGVMPETFELLYHERIPACGLDLVLWMQRRHHAGSRVAS
jgi:hypothetical protein